MGQKARKKMFHFKSLGKCNQIIKRQHHFACTQQLNLKKEKKPVNIKLWQRCRKTRVLTHCCGGVHCTLFWKTVWHNLLKLKIDISEQFCSQVYVQQKRIGCIPKTWKRMLMAVLCITALNWK